MVELVTAYLGSKGYDYVEGCLRQGIGLCAALHETLSSKGTVFAPVPAGTGLDRATKFETGGMMSWRQAKRWLGEHLESLCKIEPNSSVVVQDVWASPGDRILIQQKLHRMATTSEVYYSVPGPSCDSIFVTAAIEEVRSFLVVGIFTRTSIRPKEVTASGFVNDGLIARLAAETQEIFVSAYDHEGFVIWRR